MSYILDTHLLLWWVTDSKKLPANAKKIITDDRHDIYFSAVNVWEIAIKVALGRLDVPTHFIKRLEKESLTLVPINEYHAWHVSTLAFIHHDPFDRLLVAQAQIEKRTLLTIDKILLGYGDWIELV